MLFCLGRVAEAVRCVVCSDAPPCPVLLPRHPVCPGRAHQLCSEHRYAWYSVRTRALPHVSRTGQFVYVCPFETSDGCLAAMASLNVTSCLQVPRNTCYKSFIVNSYLVVSSAPDNKTRVVVYFDSECLGEIYVTEIHIDFACFSISGVCYLRLCFSCSSGFDCSC